MANYPAFDQLAQSGREVIDDLQFDRAVDGTGYARAFYPAPKFRLSLRHILTVTQWSTLWQFYLDNRLTTFSVAWRGEEGATYSECYFAQPPKANTLRPGIVEVVTNVEQR